MRPIVTLILTVVLLLAFSGAAEAAIASSGGGLSSAMTGAGFSSAAGSLSAGHSASVAKTLTQTLVAAGTFSTSTSGTQSATDGFVTATVQGANLHITGFLDGPGTVTATALVQARGDEGPLPDPQLWVDTLVAAATEANVLPGTHGTATARATGTATARGTMAGVGTVSAISSGTATASSDARDLFANGAAGWAQGQIWSYSSIDFFGTVIGIDDNIPVNPPPVIFIPSGFLMLRPVPLMSGATTIGGATASATAVGSSSGTATSPGTGLSGTVTVNGRTAASETTTSDSLLTGIIAIPPVLNIYFPSQGWIDGRFETGTVDDERFAEVFSYNIMGGMPNFAPGVLPDFTGTMTASATGSATANGRNPLAGATYSNTAAGSVANTVTQMGAGITGASSAVQARDGSVFIPMNAFTLLIPREAFGPLLGPVTTPYGTSWEFQMNDLGAFNVNHDMSLVASAMTMVEQGGRGTAQSSATGSAATSTTIGAWGPGIPGDRTASSANGRASVSGTASGGIPGTPINLDGRGMIISQAAADVDTSFTDLNAVAAGGTFDTNAGAISMVNGVLQTGPALLTDTFSGTVSASGQTAASAQYDDGVVAADAASRAGASLQGSISSNGPMNQAGLNLNGIGFGAETYGYAFTGSNSPTGGELFGPFGTVPTAQDPFGNPAGDFAISESAIEARAVLYNTWVPGSSSRASGTLTGGTGHGDAGFTQAGVRSLDTRSDTSGSTDVSARFTDTLGVSQTFAGTRQGAAYFPAAGTLGDVADVWTDSRAGTLTRSLLVPAILPSQGTTSAGLTGVRTSGAGTFNNLVPLDVYSVSSDATISGIMRTTENTASNSDGFSQTSAEVVSQGMHDVTAPAPFPDEATILASYFAVSEGTDALNQRGTATITGLSLTGHSASQGDSARLTLTGGMAQVNLNTLANTATVTFPVRTATLGGTPAATLGMNQGVLTGSSVTAPVNFAYGEWAGIVDSENPGATPVFPPLP